MQQIVNLLFSLHLIALCFNIAAAPAKPLPMPIANEKPIAKEKKDGLKIITSRSISLIGEPKYSDDFKHFDYVNPNAPKGGTFKIASIGTFDSLNQYATKGKTPDYLFMQYDRLMTRSQDEPYSLYPLVATHVEYPEDLSWIEFHLNPKARFHDGYPLTAEDAVFTLDTLKHNGSPFYKRAYQTITSYRAIGNHRIKFEITPNNRSMKTAALLAFLPIFPKHFWQGKSFNNSQLTIPLGSGPMKISKVDPGRSITFNRVTDYWAKDLPVNRGQFNFDKFRIDFYRDDHTALEAFAAGAYDFRIETDPRNWHQKYTFPAIKNGDIVTDKIHLTHPHGMSALVFNTRRPIFQDRNVRLALNYLFNFEWTNKHLLHSEYQRTTSFFVNTGLASTGLPTGRELALLEQYKNQISPDIFTSPPIQPASDWAGSDRHNQKIALELLKNAGWQLKNGVMTELKTNKPLEFELLLSSPVMERVFIPYTKSLAKVGIKAVVQTVDSSRFRKRARNFDFDIVEWRFWHSAFPGIEQANAWSSAAADEKESNNLAGVKHPVIDELLLPLGKINSYQDVVPVCKAIDRILLWENYVIPKWYKNEIYVAYRSYLAHPEQQDLNWFNASTWWHKGSNNHEPKMRLTP